jgi:hypothetical protein
MLLSIHIAAGGLAIVLGAIALLVKKGGTIHRRSGLLFVYSMLVLGATAALLGFRKSPTDGNVFGGLMAAPRNADERHRPEIVDGNGYPTETQPR